MGRFFISGWKELEHFQVCHFIHDCWYLWLLGIKTRQPFA